MAGRQDGRVKFILNENSKSSKCDLVIFSSKRFNFTRNLCLFVPSFYYFHYFIIIIISCTLSAKF